MPKSELNRSMGTKWYTFYTKVRPWICCISAIAVITDFVDYSSIYLSEWYLLLGFLMSILQAALSVMVFVKSKEDYAEFVKFVKAVLIFEVANSVYTVALNQYLESYMHFDTNVIISSAVSLILGYFVWYRINAKYFEKRISYPDNGNSPSENGYQNPLDTPEECMTCPQCGERLDKGSFYCVKCGAKIDKSKDNSLD